jgi:shikimate 5-dehydrogenase
LKDAQAVGAKALSGIGMMNQQGAVGEKIWFGIDMPIDEVNAELNGE